MNKLDFIERYIEERSAKDPEFKELIEDPITIRNDELRTQLIELRLKLGLTQEEFAELVEVQQSLISRLENGSQNITIGRLQSILAKTNTGARLSIDIKEDELITQK